MKKYFISAITIIVFIYYSLYQRAFGTQTLPVVAPPITGENVPSPTATPTDTPMPTATGTPLPSNSSVTIAPTAVPATPTPLPKSNSPYKDGTFTGDSADAFYGLIQVQAVISGGKITDVKFLQAPSDRSTSIYINSQADPMLTQEAIQTQSANVNIISGATDSSNAFVQSLQSALNKAKN